MPYTASLSTSITFAFERLKRARHDGEPTQICYWRQRMDELLDEFNARKQAELAESGQSPVISAIEDQNRVS